MKVLAILQARMSSSRLPGKVMAPILGVPMIALQIERVKRSKLICKTVVATSDEKSDDKLVNYLHQIVEPCFRGSLKNVLDRFYCAAREYKPEHVVRLTADCPLLDPLVIDKVVLRHLENNNDYTSNIIEPTFPDGLDVEVMKMSVLKQTWEQAESNREKEHVTPFIRNNPGIFSVENVKNEEDHSAMRWTVDEPEDYEFVQKVYGALYPDNNCFSYSDILGLLARNSELRKVNDMYLRNQGAGKI